MSHHQESPEPKHPNLIPALAIAAYVLAIASAGGAIRAAMLGNAGLAMAEAITTFVFLTSAIALTLSGPS